MQKLYRLVNHEIRGLYKYILLSVLAMGVFQNIMVSLYLKSYNFDYVRFEDLTSGSGFPLIFIIAFAMVTGICIMSIYLNYTGSKSIYTLLTLPQKREYIYLSKLTAFLISFLMLWCAQIISTFTGYGLLISHTYKTGRESMNNGLFLGFIRSNFLRIIVPFGLKSIMLTAVSLISFICSFYYGILCERSRKFKRLLIVFTSFGLLIYILNNRINILTGQGYDYLIYIISLIQMALTVFIVYDSIKIVKQGSIA